VKIARSRNASARMIDVPRFSLRRPAWMAVLIGAWMSSVPAAFSQSGGLANGSTPTEITEQAQHGIRSEISADGIIGFDSDWRVLLVNRLTSETRFAGVGELVFGYQVISISDRAVILGNAVRQFELRLGHHMLGDMLGGEGSATTAHRPIRSESQVSIPDLAAMSALDREAWFIEWQRYIATLDRRAQVAARERVRAYWREQWRGVWGVRVSAMRLSDQEEIRREISRYWREQSHPETAESDE
jgi:hypothetical protein